MSNALMIPEASAIPAYILDKTRAQEVAELLEGFSIGGTARIKMNGKQFVLIDANGDERPMKASDLKVLADGDAYLPIVILDIKKAVSKSFYIDKRNPDEEGKAPDCFSDDGKSPSDAAPMKQCDTCAACHQNAWGSGTDASGNATKGKACRDLKIVAVFCKGKIYKLTITPTSLINAGTYLRELNAYDVPFDRVVTGLGFEEDPSFPVLTFRFIDWLKAEQLPVMQEAAAKPEVKQIISARMTASTKALPEKPAEKKAAPAPKKVAPAPAPKVEDDLGLGGVEEAVIVEQAEVPDASVVDLVKGLGL